MTRWRGYDVEEIEALFRRVEELEARVALLDGGAGTRVGAAPGTPNESVIRDLMQQGRTLEAIKVYRDQTGSSLAEARAAVEALAR